MDTRTEPTSVAGLLPAQRVDSAGKAHVDQRAVLALALPLMANSAVQIVLNLTDTWFVGRISTESLAAVGASQWLILVIVLILGGPGQAVQTIVSQSFGSRRFCRAGQAVWTAMWGMLFVAPLFVGIAASGSLILAPFGFNPRVESLASQFWFPRVAGSVFGAAVWAMIGFYSGIAQPRLALLISIVTALTNVIFNQVFIFNLGLGIAGSGWASTVAQAVGLVVALGVFLSSGYRRRYKSHLTWKPHAGRLLEQLRIGFPMGMVPAADILGFSLFQMMMVRLGTVGGAASQMVNILTSVAYMPGYGISSAGTTLVGQSIGAGDRNWAMRVGTRVILLAALYMGGIGVVLGLAGPWILPLFVEAHDAYAVAAVSLGTQLLWFAAAYQFFDGLNMGSGACLRGAGDAVIPAALVIPMSWLIFVPLAHSLTFAKGDGWFHFLPQFGLGAFGGWSAVIVYVLLLGTVLFIRWRSRAWQRISL
jgi:multidrug resistance protein, MATE family